MPRSIGRILFLVLAPLFTGLMFLVWKLNSWVLILREGMTTEQAVKFDSDNLYGFEWIVVVPIVAIIAAIVGATIYVLFFKDKDKETAKA